MLRLLYVGTFPPPDGGVRLGVQTLADELVARTDVMLNKVDVSKTGGIVSRILFYFRNFIDVLKLGRRSDLIAFCAPTNYTLLFGGTLYVISRFLRRPFVVRHTAGHNDKLYREMNPLTKFLMRKTVLAAELSLYQTTAQVRFFESINPGKVVHFPNHRKMPREMEPRKSPVAKRFVFIGRLEPAKGTDDLIEVFSAMSDEIELDLYGEDNLDFENRFGTSDRIRYLGMFEHSEVFNVLQKYDALILPSLYEGQPGVIIESFLAGLPVIATSIPGVLDIVDNGETGLLVTPKAKDELRDAIETLATQESTYQRISQNVWKSRQRFSSEFWSQMFVEQCESLVLN